MVLLKTNVLKLSEKIFIKVIFLFPSVMCSFQFSFAKTRKPVVYVCVCVHPGLEYSDDNPNTWTLFNRDDKLIVACTKLMKANLVFYCFNTESPNHYFV